MESKVALKATGNMGKGLHKVFSTIVKEILQEVIHLGNLVQKFPISYQNLENALK